MKEYQTIKEMLYDVSYIYGNKIAFIDIDEKNNFFYKSYNELINEIKCLGTGMQKLNLLENKVIIIGKNSYKWALSFLTTICSNAITIPLDKELSDFEIIKCINRVEADTIIYSKEFSNRISKLKKELNIKNYISMDNNENLNLNTITELGKEELQNGNNDYINIEIDKDKATEFLFTSGTTSESKIPMLSHYNIISNAVNAKKLIHVDDKDMFLSVLPLHHTFENTCGMITPLCSGATIAYPDSLKNVLKNIKKLHPSIILVVPRFMEVFYNQILKKANEQGKLRLIKITNKITSNFKRMKLIKKKIFSDVHIEFGNQLRLFIIGGSAANPKISKFMRGLGFSVIQGYGLTECSPMVSINTEKNFKDDAVGFPVPNTDIKINNYDENGIGEIKVKGPQVMKGYYKNIQATKDVIKEDGYFYTGDLGYIDKQNLLHIKGRIKNLITASNGKNIYPEELEQLINNNELIKESMVYSKPNKNDKLCLTADIVLTDEILEKTRKNLEYKKEITKVINQYIKEINNILPNYKKINKINIKESEFEKTTTSKIKRYKCY